MAFEWDEQKRAANLAKHGIDFELAKRIFDAPILEAQDGRREYGEPRTGAYGLAEGTLLFVVYTWRGENRRLISARRAGADERKLFDTQIAAGGEEHER